MTDPMERRAPQQDIHEAHAPASEQFSAAYPPPPEFYSPSQSQSSLPPPNEALQPRDASSPPTLSSANVQANAPQADVYPPPPEWYLERARAAPVIIAPTPSPRHQPSPLDASAPPRARWRRARYRGQPISEMEVALLVISAGASFAVYTLILGWQLGLGLTVLMFVHEMGHYIVIRAKGLPARLPIFVPLMGALVVWSPGLVSARDEAEIALAGPFAGALGSAVCALAYWQTGLPVLLSLAFINLAINLFNLMPVEPLDGGRATRAIPDRIMVPWLVVVGIVSLCTANIIALALDVFALFKRLKQRDDPATARYFVATRRERRYITALYFGLIGVIVAGTIVALLSVAVIRMLIGSLL